MSETVKTPLMTVEELINFYEDLSYEDCFYSNLFIYFSDGSISISFLDIKSIQQTDDDGLMIDCDGERYISFIDVTDLTFIASKHIKDANKGNDLKSRINNLRKK